MVLLSGSGRRRPVASKVGAQRGHFGGRENANDEKVWHIVSLCESIVLQTPHKTNHETSRFTVFVLFCGSFCAHL